MSVPRHILEQAFSEGGSVIIGGKIITRPEYLPTEYERAEGDPGRQAALLAQMEADLAAKQAELDALRATLEGPEPETVVEKKPKPGPGTETGAAAEKANAGDALKATLEGMTVAQLKAEADAAGVTLPAEVNTKAEIVAFLLSQAE